MTIAAIRRYSNAKSITVAALLLLLTGGTGCQRARLDPLQQGWTNVGSEPLVGSPLLGQAEESSCVWQINQQAGKVTVSRQRILNQRPQDIRVQTSNGTLIGSNHGEWGGALTISKGKKGPPEKILDGDVLQIVPAREGFLIITGSLPSDEGALWRYSKSLNREWTIEKKADLHGYPQASYETASGIWLATGDSIYLLDDKFEVQNHNDMPWLQLHPNSIAADNSGAVYVGMQAFVVRLTPTGTGYRHEWFVGDGCLR
jgi:hypothetical protein